MRRLVAGLFSIAPLAMLAAAGPVDDLLDQVQAGGKSGFPQVGEARFFDSGAGGAERVWGAVACQERSRVDKLVRGTRTASGERRRHAYRRIRIEDGDYVSGGERCELGLNNHLTSPAVYREGERLVTFISYKLPDGFAINRKAWQIVMQMKQSQPSDGGGGGPILALHASAGEWKLSRNTGRENVHVWRAPAKTGRWTTFALDVTYSADPRRGAVRVFADLDGDGDARDRRERSGVMRFATLKRETSGGTDDGLAAGDPIPSHLRVGLYHDSEYRCVRKKCLIGIDNVGVYEP